MKETAQELEVVSTKLEEAQHRAGIARKLFETSFMPNADHEYAAADAIMLLMMDIDDALRAARVALNGEPFADVPF